MEGYVLLLNLVVFVFSHVVYVDAQDYCPQGFVEAGSDSTKCYKLVELRGETDDGWSWNSAEDLCEQQPGVNPELASIQSSLDQAILTSQFNLLNNSWPLWIGYSYSGSEWRWSDNSESTYENWQEGEPSRLGCAAMLANSGDVGQWEPLSCGEGRGYICQTFKDAADPITTPSPTAPHQCESDWTPYQDSCLLLQATPQSWQDAEDDCVSEGGHLASVWGPEDNSAMFAIAADVNELPMWIGYYKESGEFKWSDNLPRIYENFDGSPGQNNCTTMTSGAMGSWLDISCDLQLPYMCRTYPAGIPTTPALVEGLCPSADWHEWGQYCYYGPGDRDNFETAEVSCQSEGAHLVSIHSYLENELVDDLLREISSSGIGGWIGLYKEEESVDVDDYKWTDETPRDYEAWSMGEPNTPNTEHCVEMQQPEGGGVFETLWNNYRCTQSQPYICKYDKGSPSPLISPWYLLTHNASFSTDSGQDLTPECAQLYALQINENAQVMEANVNNRIGTDLCSGITTAQIKIMYTSAPFITSGSMGSTSPSYLMTTDASLTLSAVHNCMSEIHDYLGSYTNWPGGEVLRPIDNCDSVNFEGSQFEASDNRYVCLGRVNAKNSKEEGKLITEEAFLNFGVTHMGEFTTDVPMTSQCLSVYNFEFSGKARAMASVVNGLVDDGSLCATVPGVQIRSVSPIFMTAQDDQGSTTQRYVLNSTDANTFDEITTCASEISTYLQSHNNWDDPILETIEGCPSVTFVPVFEETTIEWICRDNAANANMDEEKEPKK